MLRRKLFLLELYFFFLKLFLAKFFVRLFPGGSCVRSIKIDVKLKSILQRWTEVHVEENQESGIDGVKTLAEYVRTYVSDNDVIHPGNYKIVFRSSNV